MTAVLAEVGWAPWDVGDNLVPVRRDKRKGGIFADNWIAVDQNSMQAMARDSVECTRSVRVYFAALGWSDGASTARFDPGDLMCILGASANGVQKAIAGAVRDGLLVSGSTARCLLLDVDTYQKKANRRATKPEKGVASIAAAIASATDSYRGYPHKGYP